MNAAQPALAMPEMDLDQMRSNAGAAANLLKSIANETRLLILCTLANGERSVGGLNQSIKLSQSALSQHLAILRREGLVQTRRESQTIYYSLAPTDALRVIETLHDIYCSPGC